MKSSTGPVIKVSGLGQVCVIVRDAEATAKSFWDTFGIGPWEFSRRDPDSSRDDEFITDMTYYGKPARFGYIMAGARQAGGLMMELIQPVKGDSIHRDWLRDHGEGVQHLGWHVVDTLEELARTKLKLEKAGFPCMMSARLVSSAFAYFDTTSVLHTYLEVVWRDPQKKRPPPYRRFPE